MLQGTLFFFIPLSRNPIPLFLLPLVLLSFLEWESPGRLRQLYQKVQS